MKEEGLRDYKVHTASILLRHAAKKAVSIVLEIMRCVFMVYDVDFSDLWTCKKTLRVNHYRENLHHSKKFYLKREVRTKLWSLFAGHLQVQVHEKLVGGGARNNVCSRAAACVVLVNAVSGMVQAAVICPGRKAKLWADPKGEFRLKGGVWIRVSFTSLYANPK